MFLDHRSHPLHLSTPPANGSPATTLIQSTSFLDSVPVTLTLEPRDLLGVDGSTGGPQSKGGGGALGSAAKDGRGVRTEEVELRRRPGEGFGFVIASQETPSGSECCLTLMYVWCVSTQEAVLESLEVTRPFEALVVYITYHLS